MSSATEQLPITEVLAPTSTEEVAEIVRDCRAQSCPIYPLGGETALSFGLPGRREGIGLSLAKLDQIVDYPARDMTVTVQAGARLQTLRETLAAERQRLPLDVPHAAAATVGGIVATNTNGPLQFSQGTVRDQVIGIEAVDGTGLCFHGGGRVVKNVAGYDFCKLLTGSLGTLGIITQLTFKLRPAPPERAVVACLPDDLSHAESLLAKLVHSQTTPAAIELLGGPVWEQSAAWPAVASAKPSGSLLAIAFEGTSAEVAWSIEQLGSEWRESGVHDLLTLDADQSRQLIDDWIEFPAGEVALAVRFRVLPSSTTRVIETVRGVDPACSFQAHAGNGVVVVQFPELPEAGVGKTVVGTLQSAAKAGLGSVIVLANPTAAELTRQSVWGTGDSPIWLMNAVRQQFDPDGILNPDRFVYG